MKVRFPDIEDWQKVLFRAYKEHPSGKWIVTKSVRQVGKSAALEMLLIYVSLKNRNAQSILVSPVIPQSRKIFKEITRMCVGINGLKSNASLLTIEFPNGSTIEFLSSEQGDAIRGRTVKNGGILCVDEAAYINDDFFYSVLVAFTNVADADIFICSTPRYTQGFFYHLFDDGQTGANPKVMSVDWNNWDTSKYLSPETLELYSRQMPRLAFLSEYKGEFITGASMLFPSLAGHVREPSLRPDVELVVAVDWSAGVGQDDTAITAGQVRDGMVRVDRCVTFNDRGPKETIESVIGILKEYALRGVTDISLVVETNSIGNIYIGLLTEAVEEFEDSRHGTVTVDILRFTTTNASKKRIIEQLITVFQNGTITIPDDKKLISELTTYETEVRDNGTVTYNAARGYRDDMVMSLAFLVDVCWAYI